MELSKSEAHLLAEALYWNCKTYKERFSMVPEIRTMQEKTFKEMQDLRKRIKAFSKTL
jgi:hypothetical protein